MYKRGSWHTYFDYGSFCLPNLHTGLRGYAKSTKNTLHSYTITSDISRCWCMTQFADCISYKSYGIDVIYPGARVWPSYLIVFHIGVMKLV
jgi:hypothetical protein